MDNFLFPFIFFLVGKERKNEKQIKDKQKNEKLATIEYIAYD